MRNGRPSPRPVLVLGRQLLAIYPASCRHKWVEQWSRRARVRASSTLPCLPFPPRFLQLGWLPHPAASAACSSHRPTSRSAEDARRRHLRSRSPRPRLESAVASGRRWRSRHPRRCRRLRDRKTALARRVLRHWRRRCRRPPCRHPPCFRRAPHAGAIDAGHPRFPAPWSDGSASSPPRTWLSLSVCNVTTLEAASFLRNFKVRNHVCFRASNLDRGVGWCRPGRRVS